MSNDSGPSLRDSEPLPANEGPLCRAALVAPGARSECAPSHNDALHDAACSYGYEVMLILILGKRGVTSRCNFRMRLFTEMNDMERAGWSPQSHRFFQLAGELAGDRLPLQGMPPNVGRQRSCFPPLAEKLPRAASAHQYSHSTPPGTASVGTLGLHDQALRPTDREPSNYGKGHRLPRRYRHHCSDTRR